MGMLSRRKGRAFEQAIVRALKARLRVTAHRSSQADRAWQPDVVIESDQVKFTRLWMELTAARKPDPVKKLEQAERDIDALERLAASNCNIPRWPVVVWHRLGERTTWATMRVNTLLDIVQPVPDAESELTAPVTIEFGAFLEMLEAA